MNYKRKIKLKCLRTTHYEMFKGLSTRSGRFMRLWSTTSWQSLCRTHVNRQDSPSRRCARARTQDRSTNRSCQRRAADGGCRLPDLAIGARAHGSEQLVSLRYLPFRPVDLNLVKLRHACIRCAAARHARSGKDYSDG